MAPGSYIRFRTTEFLLKFVVYMQAELGANAILAVSMAVCKAGAAEKEVSQSGSTTLTWI